MGVIISPERTRLAACLVRVHGCMVDEGMDGWGVTSIACLRLKCLSTSWMSSTTGSGPTTAKHSTRQGGACADTLPFHHQHGSQSGSGSDIGEWGLHACSLAMRRPSGMVLLESM